MAKQSCIGKDSHLLRYTRYIIHFQGKCQFFEFHIKSYSYKAINANKFSAKQIPPTYKIIYHQGHKSDKLKLLDTNCFAPQIMGKNYLSDLRTDTIKYKDKITLLDFWYMSCLPCINAIKEMEKIYEKYTNSELQIYGINSIDNSAIGIKKLPLFLKYNKFSYPFILVDESVPNAFHIRSWPSFYIIDQNGKVSYQTTGYSENISKEICNIIDTLLNKEH